MTLSGQPTCYNQYPHEPSGKIILHVIMKVASECSLQLSDGGNQERQAKDSNPALLHTSHKGEVHKHEKI